MNAITASFTLSLTSLLAKLGLLLRCAHI